MCAIPTQENKIFPYFSSGKIQSAALGYGDRRPRKFTLMSRVVTPIKARDKTILYAAISDNKQYNHC